MFYHYNNITDEEMPVLTSSFKDLNKDYQSSFMQSGITIRRKFDVSFSEKFQLVQENEKSICQIVFPKKSTIRLLILIILFVIFLYFGAWSFQMLERKNEMAQREWFKEIRQQFKNKHKCVSDSSLETLISNVETIKDMGLSAQNNASEDNWSIPTAVFFVTTLVTTIGYGNDKPLTDWGKVFCIAFVIIGLPLMMVLATAIIERMFVLIDLSFSALCLKYKLKITEDRFREIQILVCVIILIIGFVLIPALAFFEMEENRWSYLESVYYCVISLTTIGLGDFVPGDSPNKSRRDMSKILSTVYLFIGLLWASFCIQVFHSHHKWNIGAKFFYLESDILHNKYINFGNESLPNSECSSTVIPSETQGEEIETLEADYVNIGRKSRHKSYS